MVHCFCFALFYSYRYADYYDQNDPYYESNLFAIFAPNLQTPLEVTP